MYILALADSPTCGYIGYGQGNCISRVLASPETLVTWLCLVGMRSNYVFSIRCGSLIGIWVHCRPIWSR